MGYRFLSKYWGRGITTCCIRALLQYIQSNPDVELVTAHLIPQNKASAPETMIEKLRLTISD